MNAWSPRLASPNPVMMERASQIASAIEPDSKELTGPIIRYADLSEDGRMQVEKAFERRNTERLLQGKEKYASVQAMFDAYAELGKQKQWTAAEAESEVIRYLQRQALRAEGGLEGDWQDKASFALLALTIAAIAFNADALFTSLFDMR